MAFAVSNVYTPAQYVDDIIIAISASNEKFDIRDTIVKHHKKICKSKKFFASILMKHNIEYNINNNISLSM
jgi:hypothetical protein